MRGLKPLKTAIDAGYPFAVVLIDVDATGNLTFDIMKIPHSIYGESVFTHVDNSHANLLEQNVGFV